MKNANGDHEWCSFCGKAWTEVESFFASEEAMICNECVTVMYRDLVAHPPGEEDA